MLFRSVTNKKKQRHNNMEEYKIVILGSGGIGKTSITLQFVKSQFDTRYNPTIEEAYTKQFVVDDRVLKLHILDTAGQEEYTAMRDQYMRDGEGFVLVYAMDEPSSLYEVKEIYEQLIRSKDLEPGDPYPIVVIGNKTDLPEREKTVSREEALSVVRTFGPRCQFFEASAKSKLNIDESFQAIVRLVRDENMSCDDGGAEDVHKVKMEQQKPKQQKQTRKIFGSFSSNEQKKDDLNNIKDIL